MPALAQVEDRLAHADVCLDADSQDPGGQFPRCKAGRGLDDLLGPGGWRGVSEGVAQRRHRGPEFGRHLLGQENWQPE